MMNLVNARKALKKTQQEMADYLGISRQAYSNYETGKREPDYESFIMRLKRHTSVIILSIHRDFM